MKTTKQKSDRKITNSSIDNLVVRCIIEEMGKNPVSFIPIINEVLSGNNPDNRLIIKNISEGLSRAAVSQTELVKSVRLKILDMIEGITSKEIINIVNEQRISLSSDSKKFLEEVARTTMVNLCEKYFEEKRKQIDQIFEDYFKTISTYIEKQLNSSEKKCKKNAEIQSKKHQVNLEIPSSMKDDVIQYVQFLQSKK